jgi:Family of unknown function (DUF6326)
MDKKTLLSTLWVFVTLNYLYCDLIGLMDASLLKQYLAGKVEGMEINGLFLLYAGVLMEIPIAMVLLSRILPDRLNAWANVGAAFIKTTVMLLTLLIGKPTTYYCFFAVIEISTTIFIFGYAIQWLREIKVFSSVAS